MNPERARLLQSSKAAAGHRIACFRPDIRRIFLSVVSLLLILLIIGCHKKAADSPPLPYLAFVANQHGRTVAVVDLAPYGVFWPPFRGSWTQQVVARPQTHEVYAVSSSGVLSAISFPELRVVRSLRIGHSARDCVFAPDGRRAYVLDPEAGQIVFLDCAQNREVARVHVGKKLSDLALTPDGKTLVAVNSESNLIYFVSIETRNVLDSGRGGKNSRAHGDSAGQLQSLRRQYGRRKSHGHRRKLPRGKFFPTSSWGRIPAA